MDINTYKLNLIKALSTQVWGHFCLLCEELLPLVIECMYFFYDLLLPFHIFIEKS